MKTKQVIIVRKDLNMRKGKIGAQCAHASMKVFFDLFKYKKKSGDLFKYELDVNKYMDNWIHGAFVKVVVYVNSLEELEELAHKAKFLGVPYAMITDSGKTEFGGIPTKTALAIGPDDEEVINAITGHLPLY